MYKNARSFWIFDHKYWPQNGLSHNSGRGQQTDDRLAKLEADIHKLAKLYKGSQETVRSLEFK